MSIQTGEGLPRIDADDPQFSYRGITIAVKIRQLIWPVILGCSKKSDGTWEVQRDLTDDLFGSDVAGYADPVQAAIDKNGGAVGFVRKVVVSKLNAWMAELWRPTAEPPPVGTPLQQVQTALGSIRFVPQTDGTVKAEA